MGTRPILLAIAAALLGACAGTATRLPDIAVPDLRREAITQERRALAVLDANAERLLRVGRPVLLANASLCPKTRRDIGVMIHSEDNYSKEMRIAAGRELGAGEQPSVFKLAPGGPAEAAGLEPGDRVLVEGRPADPKTLRDWLADTDGPVALSVERKSQVVALTVTPDTVCDSRLRLRASGAINAYADGRNITFTSGMMDFVRDDNELALIIGHELAHNTMGHIRKAITNFILSGMATRYTRPFESEADYVGLYYMVRAGYDPAGVEDFWRRLAEVDPRSVNRAKTHPTFPDRYLRIAAARAEIEAKQRSGEALVPNYKDDAPSGAAERAEGDDPDA